MSNRKYIQLRYPEIKALVVASNNDIDILTGIQHELSFRSTKHAIKLHESVTERIDELGSQDHTSFSKTNQGNISWGNTTASAEVSQNKENKRVKSDLTIVNTQNPNGSIESANKYEQISLFLTPEEEIQRISRTNQSIKAFDKNDFRDIGVLSGVPAKRVFNKSDEVKLQIKSSDSIIKKYRVALEALIAEIKSEHGGSQKIQIYDGKPIGLPGAINAYEFSFDVEAEVFEGAAFAAYINKERIDGKIVAIHGKALILSFSKPITQTALNECTITIDRTAFLEILKDRYQELEEGKSKINFNNTLADDMLNSTYKEIRIDSSHQSHIRKAEPNINDEQMKAALYGLSNPVTYLWGPPGTGKSTTITALVDRTFHLGKRVLIVSNTNQAVDQVLQMLLKKVDINSRIKTALDDGKIIRIGKIYKTEELSRFIDSITLEGIVKRKSTSLISERAKLQQQIELIKNELKSDYEIIETYNEISLLQISKKELNDELSSLKEHLNNVNSSLLNVSGQ